MKQPADRTSKRGMKERDQDLPSTRQRLFNKYSVVRVDGKVDHEGAEYFVLRCDGLDERPADRAALSAYVTAVHPTHPLLAADLAKYLPPVDLKDAREDAAKTIGQLLPTNYVVFGIGEALSIQDGSGKVVGSFAWQGPQDTASIVATVWTMHAGASETTTADSLRAALAEVDRLKADLERLYQIDHEHHEAMVAAGLPRGCTTIEKVCDWLRAQASKPANNTAQTIINNAPPDLRKCSSQDVLAIVATQDSDAMVRLEAVKAIASKPPAPMSVTVREPFSPADHELREVKADRDIFRLALIEAGMPAPHGDPMKWGRSWARRFDRAQEALRLLGWGGEEGDPLDWARRKQVSQEDPQTIAAQYQRSMPPGFIIHFANKCEDGTECAARWTWSAPESQASSSDWHEPLLALEDAWMRYASDGKEQARKEADRAAADQHSTYHQVLVAIGMPKDCKSPLDWAEVHVDGWQVVQAALAKFVTVYEVDGAKVKNLAELELMCDVVSERGGIPVMARTYHPEFGKMMAVTIPKVPKERRDSRKSMSDPFAPRLALADIAKKFPLAKRILVIDPYAITYGGVECDNGELPHMTVVNSDVPHSATQDRAEVVVLVGRDGSLDVRKDLLQHWKTFARRWVDIATVLGIPTGKGPPFSIAGFAAGYSDNLIEAIRQRSQGRGVGETLALYAGEVARLSGALRKLGMPDGCADPEGWAGNLWKDKVDEGSKKSPSVRVIGGDAAESLGFGKRIEDAARQFTDTARRVLGVDGSPAPLLTDVLGRDIRRESMIAAILRSRNDVSRTYLQDLPDEELATVAANSTKAPGWTGITWTSRKGKAKSMSLPLRAHSAINRVLRVECGMFSTPKKERRLAKLVDCAQHGVIHLPGGAMRHGQFTCCYFKGEAHPVGWTLEMVLPEASDQQPAR